MPYVADYDKKRAKGLCGQCGEPDPIGALCQPCGLKNRARIRLKGGWKPAQPGKPGGGGRIY